MRKTAALMITLAAGVASSASAAPEGDVVVLAFSEASGKAAPVEEGSWIPVRLADLVTSRLGLIGIGARDRRFFEGTLGTELAPAGLRAIIGGKVRPESTLDPSAKLELELELKTVTGKSVKKKLSAPAGELEKLAAEIALAAADTLGVAVDPNARALLAEAEYPFAVHRFLGMARSHFDGEDFRKAMVMYDRASELIKQGTVPEAITGRLRAEAELAGRGETTFGSRADLAPPAAERAEVALRDNADRDAQRALESYLRYTPDRALRWSVEFSLARGTQVISRGAKWLVGAGEGMRGRWTIDPRTGSLLAREPSLRGLVGTTGDHLLVLEGKTLSRVDEAGRPKWKLDLPLRPRAKGNAVELTSGLAGIIGEREVIWVEVGFGALGQHATDVRPLASSAGGIIVLLKASTEAPAGAERELALLRPGKKAPTWTAKIADVVEAALTADRVLVLTRGSLLTLRAHDGKEASKPLVLGSDAHIVGADGRYAVIALEGDRTAIVDALSGEQTALVRGPGRPIACYTAANGVALFFATGDLLFFDRDGRMLDRALAPGEAIDLVRGSPMAPGPVALTSRGLFAFAEVPLETARISRDVDAMIELARVLDRQKESAQALRIATAVAMTSAGRIDRAEELRAELLGRKKDAASQAAARAAKARAEAAKDPSKPLPPFRLTGE